MFWNFKVLINEQVFYLSLEKEKKRKKKNNILLLNNLKVFSCASFLGIIFVKLIKIKYNK